MTVPRTTLMEMVRAAAQRNFLMDKGIPAGALKYSHLIVLSRLKNDEEKLSLAQECINDRLTVEALKQRIRDW